MVEEERLTGTPVPPLFATPVDSSTTTRKLSGGMESGGPAGGSRTEGHSSPSSAGPAAPWALMTHLEAQP